MQVVLFANQIDYFGQRTKIECLTHISEKSVKVFFISDEI